MKERLEQAQLKGAQAKTAAEQARSRLAQAEAQTEAVRLDVAAVEAEVDKSPRPPQQRLSRTGRLQLLATTPMPSVALPCLEPVLVVAAELHALVGQGGAATEAGRLDAALGDDEADALFQEAGEDEDGKGPDGGAPVLFEQRLTNVAANAGSDAEFGAMARSHLGKRDRIRPYA